MAEVDQKHLAEKTYAASSDEEGQVAQNDWTPEEERAAKHGVLVEQAGPGRRIGRLLQPRDTPS